MHFAPGSLVYGRMLDKSGTNAKPLPEDFTPEQVPESAKETCRNWFFKVASIRELIPRLYPFHVCIVCFQILGTSLFGLVLMGAEYGAT